MSENLGIVEPYELPVTEDTTPEPEPKTAPATVSEVDLSGYQYDIIPTYKMIEDPDDQDTLFRIQFLQAFGITTDEYHPEIVSAVINDLYERFHTNNGIREIIEAHPLYHSGLVDNSMDLNDENDNTDDTPPLSPSPHERRCAPKSENSEMIFCMMFSFQLFDLFHSCLRHAKHNEEIPKSIRDEIMECFRTMF